jgi:hypothetical protein
MSKQHEQTDEKRELKPGTRLLLTLTDNDTGKVVLEEEHEVVEAPKEKSSGVELLSATERPPMETRLLSQEWFDAELEDLNTKPEVRTLKAGAGLTDAAKIGVDLAKLGLDAGKFAWDVIKSNCDGSLWKRLT